MKDVNREETIRMQRVQYLVSSSAVLRIINLLATAPNSERHCSPLALWSSVASASRPRKMGISYFLRKSAFDPSTPGIIKLSREKYSVKSRDRGED